jgi:hypothetical protein
MSDRELTPLDPEIAALLDAERQRPDLSDVTQRQMLQRLESALADPPPAPAAASRSQRWRPTLSGFLVGLLVGGGLVGGLWWLMPPVVQPIEPPPPISFAPSVAPPSIALVALAPRPPSSRAIAAPPSAPRHAARPTQDDDERDTALAHERALLETARTALARHQREVLDLLDRHAREFPRGRLAEERESLWVQALVQAGRADEARARGARFVQRWPRSLLLPVVDAALRSIP